MYYTNFIWQKRRMGYGMQEEKELLQLCGTVEQLVFQNENTGFTVLELNTGQNLVTVVGEMPSVCEGEQLRILGDWTSHPSFGIQFKAQMCERTMPTTSAAILRYLSSGAIKGIGPVTAQKLVETFGDKTLEILENEPQRLCEIKGITHTRAMKMAEEFQKMFGIREIMIYLGQYGITPAESLRVWKALGANCVDRIRANPYLLCTEGLRIGFDRADAIAMEMDRPQDDPFRVRAGILHVMRHNLGNGHTCLPADKLAAAAARMLGISLEQAEETLAELQMDKSLAGETFGAHTFIFTPPLHRAELYAAGRLKMMTMFPPQCFFDVEEHIAVIEKEQGIQYEKLQREAIIQALSKGILILTGGPGTGKTTTLNAIIQILEWKGQRVMLAAPTGRAAMRMSQVTGREAKTIHRLLEVEWDQDDRPIFARNEKNLLECDALVVDELSMVDASLFSSLLTALPLGSRLIMVGDSDQLPSVGAGDVLHDLIDSGTLPVVQLQEVFRQSMQSLIVSNAHRIVRGELPDLSVRNNDFFFLPKSSPSEITKTIIGLCGERLPRTYGYSPLTDIQVLCPSRKGELGVVELNRRLQQEINPPELGKREITLHMTLLREGDKVMQIKNDYDIPWNRPDGTSGTGVFNGDVGILESVDKASGTLMVRFDDRLAMYGSENAENLDLAYAVTVHKSQGNEFPAVIMPMYPGPPQLYYRNLLYTAVTRAKSLLILVGIQRVVAQMVENNRKTKRYSGLKFFLTRKEENPFEERKRLPEV